jgi:uncharacterized cupin superfamily protein
MVKIFKVEERRFEANPGRKDGFGLMTDAAIVEGMAAARGGNANGRATDGGAHVADVLGRGSLNFDIRRLDPGELSSLYHFHRHAEELFMIVEGEATLRTPEGLQILKKGDIAFFGTGKGGAHQLFNHSAAPCVYLDVRTFPGADIAEYPDSGRLLVVPTMERFDKSQSTGYFEGELTAAETRKKFEKR